MLGQRAWISSTMTCESDPRVSRARLVSIRWSDSGVVIRMSGGRRTSFWRSDGGVSPDPDGDGQARQRRAGGLGRLQDPFEGELEVAEDVLVEGLQRRDVEDPDPARPPGDAPEVVQAGQERRERLARAGGGEDQRVPPRGDRRPAEPLRGRRRAERRPEPGGHRRQEVFEAVAFACHRSRCFPSPATSEAPRLSANHAADWQDSPRLNGRDCRNDTIKGAARSRRSGHGRSARGGSGSRSDAVASTARPAHLPDSRAGAGRFRRHLPGGSMPFFEAEEPDSEAITGPLLSIFESFSPTCAAVAVQGKCRTRWISSAEDGDDQDGEEPQDDGHDDEVDEPGDSSAGSGTGGGRGGEDVPRRPGRLPTAGREGEGGGGWAAAAGSASPRSRSERASELGPSRSVRRRRSSSSSSGGGGRKVRSRLGLGPEDAADSPGRSSGPGRRSAPGRTGSGRPAPWP